MPPSWAWSSEQRSQRRVLSLAGSKRFTKSGRVNPLEGCEQLGTFEFCFNVACMDQRRPMIGVGRARLEFCTAVFCQVHLRSNLRIGRGDEISSKILFSPKHELDAHDFHLNTNTLFISLPFVAKIDKYQNNLHLSRVAVEAAAGFRSVLGTSVFSKIPLSFTHRKQTLIFLCIYVRM